jgi:hypothetical protein
MHRGAYLGTPALSDDTLQQVSTTKRTARDPQTRTHAARENKIKQVPPEAMRNDSKTTRIPLLKSKKGLRIALARMFTLSQNGYGAVLISQGDTQPAI